MNYPKKLQNSILHVVTACFKQSLQKMYNIRPTLWPAEALNLASEAQNLVYLACFLNKSIFYFVKTYQFV